MRWIHPQPIRVNYVFWEISKKKKAGKVSHTSRGQFEVLSDLRSLYFLVGLYWSLHKLRLPSKTGLKTKLYYPAPLPPPPQKKTNTKNIDSCLESLATKCEWREHLRSGRSRDQDEEHAPLTPKQSQIKKNNNFSIDSYFVRWPTTVTPKLAWLLWFSRDSCWPSWFCYSWLRLHFT